MIYFIASADIRLRTSRLPATDFSSLNPQPDSRQLIVKLSPRLSEF